MPAALGALYRYLSKQASEHEARWMLEQRCGVSWADIIAGGDKAVNETERHVLNNDLTALKAGKPLSRIYGCRQFYGLDFKLNEDTLDPRPDSEVLVDIALERFKDTPPHTILDLGTGSGCLIVSLLAHMTDSHGVAVDRSFNALSKAHDNAAIHGVDSRCGFVVSDWCAALSGCFDLIVSNPPYIRSDVIPELESNVRDFDPILALDGGKDGLSAYKKLFTEIKPLLSPNGLALLEIGFDQEKDVMRLVEESGLCLKYVHPDLAGNARVVEISSGDK
jgi:release factor glutamine methyltransferase